MKAAAFRLALGLTFILFLRLHREARLDFVDLRFLPNSECLTPEVRRRFPLPLVYNYWFHALIFNLQFWRNP